MSYADYHLKLMQQLDSHQISARLTEQWMGQFCGTRRLDDLDRDQSKTFLQQLEGNIGVVHKRLAMQLCRVRVGLSNNLLT